MKRLGIGDLKFVEEVFFHEDVYPYIVDDNGIDTQAIFTMLANSRFLLLSPNRYTIFIFERRTNTTAEGHTIVLPAGRGADAIAAGKETLEWLWGNTAYKKVIGFTPVYNKRAQVFNERLGFIREGLCSSSFVFNGKLHDQIIYGISKEN